MLVHHKTPFRAALLQILDRDGSEGRVALLKATYEIPAKGVITICEEQEEIIEIDEYLGEPGRSTVLRESDASYYKPTTDIVVIGSVFAPQGKPVRSCLAGLRVGALAIQIKAFGERRWSAGALFGPTISAPEPFAEVPLCWERAFGGVDVTAEPGEPRAWEPRNPVGTGLCANRRHLDGLLLPNIENPDQLITSWQDRPRPAGLSFTGRAWSPRVHYAGTYDRRWQEQRAPILPKDFDYRFFNGAPPGLMMDGFLQGGEAVELVNLSPRGYELFMLPTLEVVFDVVARGKRLRLPGHLDTLVLDPTRSRLSLLWRLKYLVDRDEVADEIRASVRFVS